MSCLVAWAAVCLFNPDGVYVRGEIITGAGYTRSIHEGYWCYDHACRGPQAELRIGVEVQLPKGWEFNYGFLHRSFPFEPHDRGFNVPFISLEWRPFQ